MPDEKLAALWTDSTNWTVMGLYRCTHDPRWWVRKRDGGGWTINIAHRGAVLTLVGMIVASLIPVVATVLIGYRPSKTSVLVFVGIQLGVVVFVAVRTSIRDR